MALIKCQECGREISDKASSCPGCGAPIEKQDKEIENTKVINSSTQNQNLQQNAEKKKESILGIIGLIISFIVCIPIFPAVGLIMCVVAITDKSKKTTCAKIGIVLSILFLIIGLSIWGSDSDSTTEDNANNISSEESLNNISSEEKNTEIPTPTETPDYKESKEEFIAKCEEIPYKTLARNPQEYIDSYIVLDVKVEQILQGGLFDDNQYYRVYTNDDLGMWLGDEYFMYDARIEDDMKILEYDTIKVYGKFIGTETVTRALTNNKEEVPAFKAVYIELLDENNTNGLNEEILNDGTIDIDFSDFSIQYDSYELANDYEKNPCVIIYFNFTNNSPEPQSAGFCTQLKAFQDGVSCDSALIFEDNQYIENYYKDVISGTTIKVGQAFVINSENDLLLEASEYLSFNEFKDSMTINLK